MRDHNKIITQALNDYLNIENPGYGVLIKGSWGCGKSFFIKGWKKAIEKGLPNTESEQDEAAINLKPLYVSLNGLSSVSQIDEALKREISPFLHGKFMKGLGKAFKFAASVALRFNVDANGDGTPEQMVCTIDPKTILEFDPTKVKGKRIIIFDDIERARIPIEEVLGYINYFVEQVGCHVVMVGDVENIDKKDDYKAKKEKTIGHEYQLEPETEEALNVFVAEIDKDGKMNLNEYRQLISYCFAVSKVNNLRILRQSLYDYKLYVSHLPNEIIDAPEFKSISQYLLSNFIAIYAEYKSGNLVMERFNKQLVADNMSRMLANKGDKTPLPATPAADTLTKYQKTGLSESHRVLNQGYVTCVMDYLTIGVVNSEFLSGEINRDRSTPWEKLNHYNRLNNKEFETCLNQTAVYLEKGEFESIDYMLMATCSMMDVIKKKMTYNYTVEKVMKWSMRAVEEYYFPACKTLDELYTLRGHAIRCLGYYQGITLVEECNQLRNSIEDVFERIAPTKRNSLTVILDSLTDEKISQLVKIYMNAVPDHSVTYSMTAVFAQVDPEKFVNGFVGLSNDSKVEFIQLIKHHYHQAFAASNAKEFVHYYEEDLNKLPDIVNRLKEAADTETLVNKQNIEALADVLNESGDTIQVLMKERDN